MSVFDVNWSKLSGWLLPTRLRSPRLLAWVKALTAPVVWLYGQFRSNRDKNLYRMNHGQHIAHLEAVLNDKYDAGFRRIKIVDGETLDPCFLYRDIENKPLFIKTDADAATKWLYNEEEIDFSGFDFVVQIPFTIPYDEDELQQLVNDYKTPGMGYIIEQI